MAIVHKLSDYDDTTIDLTGGTWELLREGYVPQVAVPPGDGSIPPYVTETLPVKVETADGSALATALQNLAVLQRRAAEYWADPAQSKPVYYHQKLDAEVKERRALVREIVAVPRRSLFSTPAPTTTTWDLMISRHPYWEATGPVLLPGQGFAGGNVVGIYNPASAGDIPGDVPARFRYLQFNWNSSTSGDIDRVWAGGRSASRHGNLANFEPVWECERGVSGTDCTSQTDSTASGGEYCEISPGTETWARRVTIRFSYIVTTLQNRFDNYGTFLFLLRCKCGTDDTWEVKLKAGYSGMGDAAWAEQPSVTVTNDEWDFYEMGYLTIPPPGEQFRVAGTTNDEWGVQIWARRTAWLGNLDLDCLVLIPVDEGFLHVSGMAVELSASTSGYFATLPTDENIMVVGVNSIIKAICPFVAHNFRLPIGDCRIVIAYARSDRSVLTDYLIVHTNSNYYARWLALRGSE